MLCHIVSLTFLRGKHAVDNVRLGKHKTNPCTTAAVCDKSPRQLTASRWMDNRRQLVGDKDKKKLTTTMLQRFEQELHWLVGEDGAVCGWAPSILGSTKLLYKE